MAIQSRDQVEVSAVRRFAPVLAALLGIGRRRDRRGHPRRSERGDEPARLHLRGDRATPRAAADLERGVGDQLLAKLVLGLVALVVGVGGIWMLYIGVSAVVGLLSPRWQGRILPWVFVVPAVALLVVYLVYPTIGTIVTSFTVADERRSARELQAARRHRSSSASLATTSSGSSSPPAEASCSAS